LIKYLETILYHYDKHFTDGLNDYEQLKSGVSDKLILRLKTTGKSIIGIYNSYSKENITFLEFTKVFDSLGLNVPKILYVSDDFKVYFLSDLGENTLFDSIKIIKNRESLISLYEKALEYLIKFQYFGKQKINFSYCFETRVFDKEQIYLDTSKFESFYIDKFLNSKSKFHKDSFINNILNVTVKVSDNYFMYRDFQPRNIVHNNDDLYFVDYQSGRLGPPQYDLISFLYSGSISITQEERNLLSGFYFDEFSKYEKIDKAKQMESLDYFALLRIIQVLGSYCYSYFEKGNKKILDKIPTAIENLKTLKLQDKNLKLVQKFILDSHFIHTSKHQ
jgi:aminoglycoside/choline kinase family phosphotransferase